MSYSAWITIPNWDEFQHYRDRRPYWIKNYTALLHKDEYTDLHVITRGLLHWIWLAYADQDGRLRTNDALDVLPMRMRRDYKVRHLIALRQAGFIEFSASKPVSLSSFSIKDKKESRESAADERTRPTCPECGITVAGRRKLAEHLYVSHSGPEPTHWLEVEAKADLG